jgi:hypothetical protein
LESSAEGALESIVRPHQKHAIPVQPNLVPWCEMAIELRT